MVTHFCLQVLSATDRGRPRIDTRAFLAIESGYTKGNFNYSDVYLELEEVL
jgi:hypothetical protein